MCIIISICVLLCTYSYSNWWHQNSGAKIQHFKIGFFRRRPQDRSHHHGWSQHRILRFYTYRPEDNWWLSLRPIRTDWLYVEKSRSSSFFSQLVGLYLQLLSFSSVLYFTQRAEDDDGGRGRRRCWVAAVPWPFSISARLRFWRLLLSEL